MEGALRSPGERRFIVANGSVGKALYAQVGGRAAG